MAGAAEHLEIPVIISIAVAAVVIIWLVHFITGIRRTRRFYRQKTEEQKNAADMTDLSDEGSCESGSITDDAEKEE